MLSRVAIFGCIAAALSGCGNYFAPNRNVKELLSKGDVIGVWTMTATSLAVLRRDGFQPPPGAQLSITIHTNGVCEYSSVVGAFRKPEHFVATGIWTLEHDTTGSSNDRKNVLRLEIPGATLDRIISLSFAREKGQLILWEYYGDPDSWEFIEYSRGG